MFFKKNCILGMTALLVAGGVSTLNTYAKSDRIIGAEYATLNEARDAGNKVNEKIAEEAMILMKNQNNSLPLAEAERNVTFFGTKGDLIYGGAGSGHGVVYKQTKLINAMKDNGFQVNPSATFGQGNINALDNFKGTYSKYGDCAFMVINRNGSEGSDLRTAVGDGTKHYLELTDQENQIIDYITGKAEFKKVVILINTSNIIEIAHLMDNPRINAIIQMGLPGDSGSAALPRILKGTVNPSGHTADVWPADFRQDPTWFNFGTNEQTEGTTENSGTGPDGNPLQRNVRSLDYEEGVYVGYKWYETASTIEGFYKTDEQYKDPAHPDDPYYNRFNGVVAPFGYGLSYTTFDWEVGNPSLEAGKTLTAADAGTDITIPVKVTNTGKHAGKELVQAYVRAPYDANTGIEKADSSLIEFTKTKLLAPGESQTIELNFNVRDLASFDWNDINKNDFKGYELEKGDYEIMLRTNSHDDKNKDANIHYLVGDGGIQYSGNKIDDPLNYNMGHGHGADAVFSKNDAYNSARVGAMNENGDHINATAEGDAKYVTRRAWRMPEVTKPGDPELEYSKAAVDHMFTHVFYTASMDKPTDPWYKTKEDIPGYGNPTAEGAWKQAPANSDPNRKAPIQLKDMTGIPLDDPKWVEFMNQLTWSEMTAMVADNNYVSHATPAIGKPFLYEADGPGQIRRTTAPDQYGTFWCSLSTQSCAFNEELAYELGRIVGNEALLIKVNGAHLNAWYAPGMNTHRCPFGGRNFEYYSQDGVHAGKIGAQVVRGATDMGLRVYGKHYAVNEQDTDRNANGGISVWTNEQALREIYLRPFEIATKVGHMNGMMTTHGKLGLNPTQQHYHLTQTLPRGEWGLRGAYITDLVDGAPVRAGRSQMTSGDMLMRCGNMYLGKKPEQFTAEARLLCDGRNIEGVYDPETNTLKVPSQVTIQNWVGQTGSSITNDWYDAELTHGDFDMDSPTQWYHVRVTAMQTLYVAANGNPMSLINDSDLYGVTVRTVYNDGVTPNGMLVLPKGSKLEQPVDPVVSEGKRFMGWYLDEACTIEAEFGNEIKGNIVTLYAKIIGNNSYQLSFNLNYEGSKINKLYVEKGQMLPGIPFNPVREGFSFMGWYTDAACNNPIDLTFITPTEDMVFYAKWLPIPTHTVIFDLNYEGVRKPVIIDVYANTTIEAPILEPTRAGYKFVGWYRDAHGTAAYDFSKAVDKDFKLYAKWEKLPEITLPEQENTALENVNNNSYAYVVYGIISASVLAGAALLIFKRK